MTYGGILALLVLIFAVLMMASIIPMTPVWVGGGFLGLALCVFGVGFPVRLGPPAA